MRDYARDVRDISQRATDRFLTKPEVRESLHIGPRLLNDLIQSGALEIVRLGRRTVRIRESAIRRLVEERLEKRVG